MGKFARRRSVRNAIKAILEERRARWQEQAQMGRDRAEREAREYRERPDRGVFRVPQWLIDIGSPTSRIKPVDTLQYDYRGVAHNPNKDRRLSGKARVRARRGK